MNKIKKRNIKEICNEIVLIITGKNIRIDYKYITFDLRDTLNQKISCGDIVLICDTIIRVAKTKNRIIRNLEKGFWYFINSLLFEIMSIQDRAYGKKKDYYQIPTTKTLIIKFYLD